MWISNKDATIQTFDFPDGQQHIKLTPEHLDDSTVDVSYAIRNAADLFSLMQVAEILKHNNRPSRLNIKYLMGDRMERRISNLEPATLTVVCNMINMAFPDSPVRVFCPHSDAASFLLKNYDDDRQQERNFFHWVNKQRQNDVDVILPDAGAGKRWHNYMNQYAFNNRRKVECSKQRDMSTGQLSGFGCPHEVKEHCVIVDDLCDGGGTFCGLAVKLRENGAKTVDLAVCHGIFSKGYRLEGIDHIFTTNSYQDHLALPHVSVYRV